MLKKEKGAIIDKEWNKRYVLNLEGMKKGMEVLILIYILIFIIITLIIFAVMQLKMVGIKVKDFWSFIEANQMLDKLYAFATKYKRLSTQEQLIFLKEAEKVFDAFEKVPDMLWEEEYQKYMEVLNT